jgi:predicted RNase H-like nuclease (RuvC/YqgF family)
VTVEKLKRINIIIVSTLCFGITFTPISSSISKLIGQSNIAEAKKTKPLTQQEFNQKVAQLGRSIKDYKQRINGLNGDLNEMRSSNAELFGSLFEDETVDFTDKELLDFYTTNITKIISDSSELDNFLESYEIDEIATLVDAVSKSYSNTYKLNAKINDYETRYTSAVKSKNFDLALSIRTDQVKLYDKLYKELETANNAESSLNESLRNLVEQYNDYVGNNASDDGSYTDDGSSVDESSDDSSSDSNN